MKDSVFIRAPAKLNLFLNIIGQNNNGYHNIRTGITFLDLYDVINISVNDISIIEGNSDHYDGMINYIVLNDITQSEHYNYRACNQYFKSI